jgi:O-antigen ligase
VVVYLASKFPYNSNVKKSIKQEHLPVAIGILVSLAFSDFLFDSIMLPKFLILVIGSLMVLYLNFNSFLNMIHKFKIPAILSSIYLSSILITGISNKQSLYEVLVGSFARYNGMLSAFSLIILFLVVTNSRENTFLIVTSLVSLGYVFVFFGLLEVMGLNLTNQITRDTFIKLTIGNSNFASIVLVMTFIATFAKILFAKTSYILRLVLILSLFSHLFLIFNTKAMQGYITCAVSILFLTGARLMKSSKRFNIEIGYFIWFAIPTIGVLTLIDVIYKGPISKVINFNSLIDRFYVWKAALAMGKEHLLTGVGVDSFNLWFGEYMQKETTGDLGPVESYDSAHNIFMQYFATGGLFLFVSYSLITFFVLYCVYKLIKLKQFNDYSITLICIWFIFQLQSLVSPENIVISTWLWIISGALVSEYYSKVKLQKATDKVSSRNSAYGKLSIYVMLIAFILFILPTLKAEYRVNQIIKKSYVLQSKDIRLASLEISSLTLPLMYPELKVFGVAVLLKFQDSSGALSLARDCTNKFPRFTRGWAMLATVYEQSGNKALALSAWEMASTLDPLNSSYRNKIAGYLS